MPNQGDINPSNSNYVWGSNNRWVLKSTTGSGGQNAGVTTTPTTTPTITLPQDEFEQTFQQDVASGNVASINFRSGLSQAQQTSINNLVANKPQDQWNSTDWANYNYATGSSGSSSLDVGQQSEEVDIANESSPIRAEGSTGNDAYDSFVNSTINTGLTQAETSIQNLLVDLERQRAASEAEAQKRQDNAALGLENIQNGPSLEDTQRRLMEEFGIEETKKQLEQYRNQLIALNEQAGLTDQAIKNKPIHAAAVRGQRAMMQEQFAYKAATIQAKIAVAGEQYDLAAQTVNSLFQAAAQDRRDTMSYYERLFDLARQDVISLNSEERENINAQIGLIQNAEQRAQENKEKIASLFTDPVLAKAFQQSGASLNDDFATTMQKMLPFINDENARLKLLKSTGSGSAISTTGSTFNNSIQDAASQLITSRDSGNLTDSEYNSVVSNLVDSLYNTDVEGFDVEDAWNQVSSLVNTAMEGKPLGQAQLNEEQQTTDITEDYTNQPPQNILSSWFTNLSDRTGFTDFATNPAFSSLFNTLGVYDRFGLNYSPDTDTFNQKK